MIDQLGYLVERNHLPVTRNDRVGRFEMGSDSDARSSIAFFESLTVSDQPELAMSRSIGSCWWRWPSGSLAISPSSNWAGARQNWRWRSANLPGVSRLLCSRGHPLTLRRAAMCANRREGAHPSPLPFLPSRIYVGRVESGATPHCRLPRPGRAVYDRHVMKVLFTVQGEGRGHLTQAIALKQVLEGRGHRVVEVLVGTNPQRVLPNYFLSAFGVPIHRISSPGFVFHGGRSVAMGSTLCDTLRRLPLYRAGLRVIDDAIQRTQPDLIVNFLEPLLGLHRLLRPVEVPAVVVGHHYMFEHPDFAITRERRLQQQGMRAYIRLVGTASVRLALSFYPAPDAPERNLFVCPPLMRRQLLDLKSGADGDYLLAYVLCHGYAEDIRGWQARHPETPVHCFCDRPGAPEEEVVGPGMTFHRLHGEKFLRMMAGCRALACTAGFESVCEAAYLQKPLLVVPVENHVEQFLNAVDAERAGIAQRDDQFTLSRLTGPNPARANGSFRQWVDQSESLALRVIEQTAADRVPKANAIVPEPLPVWWREQVRPS